MPFLETLARQGIEFTHAYSTHDFTPTSHYSIMTGFRDGIATDDDRVENGVPFQLQRSGYATFATVANSLLNPKAMPVHRGFGTFVQHGDISEGTVIDSLTERAAIDERLALFQIRPTPQSRARVRLTADAILPIFLDQMRREPKEPSFGFVNLVDTHDPYVPDPAAYAPETTLPPHFNGDIMGRRLPPEFEHPDLIRDQSRRESIEEALRKVGRPRLLAADLSADALAVYRARYRATARDLDGRLREFFTAASREHLLDHTIVIITSDHGESFGESGFVTHMLRDQGDYESTHHVPLIVLLPEGMTARTHRIDRKVSLASLAPTIYDLTGTDWTAFATKYRDYPRSLAPLLVSLPPRAATTALPSTKRQDHDAENREREAQMRALGYIQ